jgi:hypothetical protein
MENFKEYIRTETLATIWQTTLVDRAEIADSLDLDGATIQLSLKRV